MYVVVRRSRPTGFPVRKSASNYTFTFGLSVKLKHAIYIMLANVFIYNKLFILLSNFLIFFMYSICPLLSMII